jgi:hypothetical protein
MHRPCVRPRTPPTNGILAPKPFPPLHDRFLSLRSRNASQGHRTESGVKCGECKHQPLSMPRPCCSSIVSVTMRRSLKNLSRLQRGGVTHCRSPSRSRRSFRAEDSLASWHLRGPGTRYRSLESRDRETETCFSPYFLPRARAVPLQKRSYHCLLSQSSAILPNFGSRALRCRELNPDVVVLDNYPILHRPTAGFCAACHSGACLTR